METALSCPSRASNVISSAPVCPSFSRPALGSQAPSLWPLPEAAAASCVPLFCHGPRAVPAAQPGQPPCPIAVSFSLIWNSGLHVGPPVHLSLQGQGPVNGVGKAWATSRQCSLRVPAPGQHRGHRSTHSLRGRHPRAMPVAMQAPDTRKASSERAV